MENKKMSDEDIDALFEKLDSETAKKIDNQHTPIRKQKTQKKKKATDNKKNGGALN